MNWLSRNPVFSAAVLVLGLAALALAAFAHSLVIAGVHSDTDASRRAASDLMGRALKLARDDPEALARYTIRDLVELAGSQGTEFIHWLIMRGALGGRVKRLHSNYHIPVSNTAAGLLLLENAA